MLITEIEETKLLKEEELNIILKDFCYICGDNLLETTSKEIYSDLIYAIDSLALFLKHNDLNNLDSDKESPFLNYDLMLDFVNNISNLPKSIISIDLNFFNDHVKKLFNTQGMSSFIVYLLNKKYLNKNQFKSASTTYSLKSPIDFDLIKTLPYIHFISDYKEPILDFIMKNFEIDESSIFKLISSRDDYIYFKNHQGALIDRAIESCLKDVITNQINTINKYSERDYDFLKDAINDCEKEVLKPKLDTLITLLKNIEVKGLTEDLEQILSLIDKKYVKALSNQLNPLKIDLKLGLGDYKTIARLNNFVIEYFDAKIIFYSSIENLKYSDFNKESRLFMSSMSVEKNGLHKLIMHVEEMGYYEILDGKINIPMDIRMLLEMNYKI